MVRTKMEVYKRNIVWKCGQCETIINWERCKKCGEHIISPISYRGELFCYGGVHYCITCGRNIFKG